MEMAQSTEVPPSHPPAPYLKLIIQKAGTTMKSKGSNLSWVSLKKKQWVNPKPLFVWLLFILVLISIKIYTMFKSFLGKKRYKDC